MRNNRSRPTSQHANPSAALARLDPLVGRKIFNCIVDDTALVAGVKKSTRNGIRQWVKNGQIRLFVPLHGMHMDRGSEETGNAMAADTSI
jgi:hypothetical protein